MQLNRVIVIRAVVLVSLMVSLTIVSSRMKADTGTCGGMTVTLPFTDVMGNPFFCQIAAAYFSGLTNGTTAITFSPTQTVTREQMAAFVTRTMDQSLKRGSRRAALNQWWTTTHPFLFGLGVTTISNSIGLIQSDGADLWIPGPGGIVSRVRASDAKLLETWTGATGGFGVLIAMGRVFVCGAENLYMIDPSQAPGPVTLVASNIGTLARSICFDGTRIWTANLGDPGSVSIITPGPTLPWAVTTVTNGFMGPTGIVYDGTNMWVADQDGALKKLDTNGNIIQSVLINSPSFPIFDGTNIWVPQGINALSVVRASSGTVLSTLTGNGLSNPVAAAFDGERILVTNRNGGNLSLWKAADLTPIGTFPTGDLEPYGVCSDGINFWITSIPNKLARF